MKLITQARRWYRMHSVQLALIVGPAVGWAIAHPDEVRDALAALHAPGWLLGVVAWLLASGIPIFLRLRQQGALGTASQSDRSG